MARLRKPLCEWAALKRTRRYQGSREKRPKFWMVIGKKDPRRAIVEDACRDYPGITAKEIARYFGIHLQTATRYKMLMRREWRRELEMKHQAKSSTMKDHRRDA